MADPELQPVSGNQPASTGTHRRHHDRSTIGFPYVDLDAAQEVALAIHTNGGNQGDTPSLASWMNHTANSGTFNNKIAAARLFGLVTKEKGVVTLTDLGHEIVDPAKRSAARARAFRCVPLYDAIFTKYEGKLLPATVAIHREMEELGVAPKQVAKARQVFTRAAEQAGYFDAADDRLTTPAILFREGAEPPVAPPQRREDGDGGNGSGDGGQSGYTYPLRHDGRTITIALNGDVLALAKEDRVFVLKLIDQIEEYGAAGEEPKLLSPGDGADEPESVAQATG